MPRSPPPKPPKPLSKRIRQRADAELKTIDQHKTEVDQAKAREEQARLNAPLKRRHPERPTLTAAAPTFWATRPLSIKSLLNLQYTKITSPANGIVGKKSLSKPECASVPGQELLAIIPLDDIWITANFKDTQLRRMHENQRVTIKVDAFGRKL